MKHLLQRALRTRLIRVFDYNFRILYINQTLFDGFCVMIKQDDLCMPDFLMRVVETPRVRGIKTGLDAVMSAGAQSEFVVDNILQANAMKCALILRAGAPPQYNKKRSPKPSDISSKTSNQSFFKGAIPVQECFARIETGKLRPHDAADKRRLSLKPTDANYLPSLQLDINMRDVLREVGPNGDLILLGFDGETGLLRLAYKAGFGPNKAEFSGQFLINLYAGDDTPQVYSREWDKPEYHPGWDKRKKVITKPESCALIPDEVYEACFHQQFKLSYSEEQIALLFPEAILPALVFAVYPADERGVKEASIIAGDWDGLALGHPVGMDSLYQTVFNTHESESQRRSLMRCCQQYFLARQSAAELIPPAVATAFDALLLSIESFSDIVKDAAIQRAGLITPYEFFFQQMLNHAYGDQERRHYGEKVKMEVLQAIYDELLTLLEKGQALGELLPRVKMRLKEAFDAVKNRPHNLMLNGYAEHISNHLKMASLNQDWHHQLPHPHYDPNLNDLYQHGFDMRNPYGCNLQGAWLLISPQGGVIYGECQEQLIEVMLTGDFLKDYVFDVNYRADMAIGWEKVIERQIRLRQTIPDRTLLTYAAYLHDKKAVVVDNHFKDSLQTALSRCANKELDETTQKNFASANALYSMMSKRRKGSGHHHFFSSFANLTRRFSSGSLVVPVNDPPH